ncbi:MAG: MoaD/ThiS family protein [Bacillota bacterium]|nr:MoaD/ThiS family protein [Bacillota bacterium]
MTITVYLHDILKEKVAVAGKRKNSRLELVMPAGATTADLLDQVGLQPSRVGMIVTGGRRVGLDYRLQAGDIIQLFAPLAGG